MWQVCRGLTRPFKSVDTLRSRRKTRRLALDWLEPRTLLSNVSWTGTADGKSWAVAGNWSNNAVPTPGDNVTINIAGNPTIQITTGSQSVHSLTASEPISIIAGSLRLGAASTLSGGLTMTGGALVANGASFTATVTGTTTISGGSVFAEGGATLSLSTLTSYSGELNTTDTLEATGAGSVLNMPKLAAITEDTGSYGSHTLIEALSAGDVELAKLATISGGPVTLESDGSGSKLNAPLLASVTGHAGQQSSSTLQASNSGSLLVPEVATFDAGTIVDQGATLNLPVLATIDGSSVLVSSGSQLSLPALLTFSGGVNYTDTLQATGTGSRLSLPALTKVTEDTSAYGSLTQVQAVSGGDVELPALTTITGGPVALESDGSGSKLNAPLLTSVTGHAGQQSSSTLQASNSGSLLVPEVATFDAGTIVDQGATLNLPVLATIDGSSVLVSSGSQLSLPALLTFSGGVNYTDTLQATGTGSRLSLPALTKVTEDTSAYGSLTQVQAVSGGDVELPALTTITGGPVALESDGSGSKLNAPLLTSVTGSVGHQSSSTLQASNSGSLLVPEVATFDAGTIVDQGATLNLPVLATIDGSSVLVSTGSQLSLPALLTFSGGVNYTDTLQATGTGSRLSLPALTKVTGDTSAYGSLSQVKAVSGGDVELPALTTITGGPVQLESDGSGSTLNINVLTSIQGNAGQQSYSGLQATNDGTVSDAALVTINKANLSLDGTGTISINQIATFTAGTLSLGAGTETYTGLIDADGSSLEATGGASLSFPSLASYAGGVNYTSTLEASGSGGKLLFPKLATLTSDTANYSSRVQIEALAGGEVSLPLVTQITGGPVQIESDGSGSQLIAPALTTFQGHTGQQFISSLQETGGGMVDAPDLASINSVNFVGDASGSFTISASLGLSIAGGTSTVSVGTLLDQGNLAVESTGTLNIQGGLTVNSPGDSDDSGRKHCRSQRQPPGQFHEHRHL